MKFSSSKYYIFWILAVCLLVFVVIGIVEAKKPTPKPEEPLELYYKNIVTTTPIGEIMRVWGSLGPNADYENIWTKERERYKAVALGDIDGIPNQRELYAASVNYIRGGREKKDRTCSYRIVVDVFRDGEEGIRLSSPEIWDRSCVSCELILADVCGDPDSEIILSTDHNVVVFGYAGAEIIQLAYKDDIDDGIFPEQKYWINAMAVADIDTDSKNEILLGVNPVGYDAGYLFIYDLVQQEPYSLNEVTHFPCPDWMRIWSLATGVDSSGSFKICATAYEYSVPGERIYQNYLLIWKWDGTLNFEGYDLIGNQTRRWFSLDVGDVLIGGYPGDEIVLLLEEGGRSKLELYSLLNGLKINGWEALASSEEANLSYVYIADSDGDGFNEIVCVGGAPQKSGKGGKGGICGSYYYIEVFGVSYDGIVPKLDSEWQIIGGDRCQDEAPWDTSIG